VQASQGFPALSLTPATSSSVLLYLGWLQEEDKVHVRSLQPYMSAINQAHVDFGFPPPAVGQLVRLARRVFGEVERGDFGRRWSRPSSRFRGTADLAPGVGHSLCSDDLRLRLSRDAVLVVARADTGIHLRDGHVGIGEFGVTLSERTKTISRHLAAPVTRPFHADWDPDGLVLRLLRRWLGVCGPVPYDAYFWSLPVESPVVAWTCALINTWLQEILSTLGEAPPLGCSWTSHSRAVGGLLHLLLSEWNCS
jgi:hypothetical protein